jgi:integrase/recombinase XerD
MTSVINLQAQTRAWLSNSALHPYVPGYASHLERGRYAPNTQRVYLCCVAHFALWLTQNEVAIGEIDESTVSRFVSGHLPHCDCPYPVRRGVHDIEAALRQLLQVLRGDGTLPSRAVPAGHIVAELARFDDFMRDAGGLAAATREQRCRILGQFLTEAFDTGRIVIASIKPTAIRRFVLPGKVGRSAGTIRVMGGAIGSYLRFRAMDGDHIDGLRAAIPRAAHWRLASFPDVLSDAEITELHSSFDAPFRSWRRAYAMVRCLTDLGLRCADTAGLRLEDIDWVAGTIRLAGTKTRRVDILPLPVTTGAAIAAYLQDERPSTLDRALFVRHVAPFDIPLGKGVVRRAVLAAYQRCGWTRTRVHILRHSVASRLLQAGTPMKEIADILRHRSLDTSAIYTKVGLTRLASVALPWPGSVS